MSGIPCKCGRFLAKPHAVCDSEGEGYAWHMFLSDVRGDCKRCGPDVPAMRGDGWWWSWDAWKWPPDLESAYSRPSSSTPFLPRVPIPFTLSRAGGSRIFPHWYPRTSRARPPSGSRALALLPRCRH